MELKVLTKICPDHIFQSRDMFSSLHGEADQTETIACLTVVCCNVAMVKLPLYGLGANQKETPPLSMHYHGNATSYLTWGVCHSFMISALGCHIKIF
jgi:hypothetical protein